MAASDHNPVTRMLHAASTGDPAAAEQLLPLVYSELRALAKSRLARTPPGNTLQATALVHEAYLRLVGDTPGADSDWDSRAHFFGAASRAMRNILVEQARRKAGPKAGGGRQRENVDAADVSEASIEPPAEEMLALDAALTALEAEDPRKAQVVMLKYFSGLSHEQIAAALGCSLPTIERDWKFAKAWLKERMDAGK
ncbi:MAG: ECF-type sigma factor [Phycisphaerales bacterium]